LGVVVPTVRWATAAGPSYGRSAIAPDPGSDVVVTCTKLRKGASVRVTATVLPVESDPIAANDVDSSQTQVR